MDKVLQYDIPVVHPVAVHFPIALIVVAAFVALVWAIRGTAFWRRATLLLLSVGMIGLVVAYLTGESIEEHVEGTPIVEELVGLHETTALYALIVTGVALAGVAALSFWMERRTTLQRDPPDPISARLVLTLITVAAAILVAWTGHIGGTMVWGV
jgi:uncharacterized membrane protein